MSNQYPQRPKNNYQKYTDKKLLKDQPFYRRNPRAFVIIGSSLGLLILFSRGLYDFFRPTTFQDFQRQLVKEKQYQLHLQETLKKEKQKDKEE